MRHTFVEGLNARVRGRMLARHCNEGTIALMMGIGYAWCAWHG